MSKWGKETKCLKPWQNSIAYGVGKSIQRKGFVSAKQAKQAQIIYDTAKKYGFEDIKNKEEVIVN